MSIFNRTVTVDFAAQKEIGVADWLSNVGLTGRELPPLTVVAKVQVDLSDFDEEEISEAYDNFNKPDRYSLEQIYRLMAEGDIQAAMDEMHRQFDLPLPSHEKKVADLLSRGRA
jgi:hypothetical protein